MLLRVLGPIEVAGVDGPVALGGAKPRALVAALAIAHGAICPREALIDALWGEAPPASASKLVHVYISQLRKALPTSISVRTTPVGYTLELDPAEIDSVHFEHLVAEGRAALQAGNPALASATLARGLALWRGPAYADVRYESFAVEEIERLEHLRDRAVEGRVDADLQLGRHAEVLAELRGLLASDPTRETLGAMAMIAAYRSGAASEALAIFKVVADALDRDLGEPPGPELVAIRDRIVRRDPTLEAAPAIPASPIRQALPSSPNGLIGRRRELAELRSLLGQPGVRLVTMTGAGGSGKSRLALELARDVGATYANGVALVELASLRDPDLVPATIASELRLGPGPDAMATLLEALAGRELLLVLDNVEHLRGAAPDLLRLLAGAPRITIVATSRVVLHVTGEHVYPVSPLGDDEAMALFVERARASDPSVKLDDASRPQVAAICRRVDNLPLPIELAASRVRALGLRTLDARLASRLTVLAGGPRDLPARQRTLRETLAWSVNLLDPAHQQVLAGLAVFPSGCPMDGAVAVADADDESLTALVDHSLVQAADISGERRYRLLETVREYGQELLGARREPVEAALTKWVVGVVEAILPDSFSPIPPAAYDRLDIELDNIRDALRHSARDPDPTHELTIASGVWKYWWVRGYLSEGLTVCDDILRRRGFVRTPAGIRTARAAASLAWATGGFARAEALGREVLDLAVSDGDIIEQASVLNLLGVIARSRGALEEAERDFARAIELAHRIDNTELAAMYQGNLGTVYLDAGRLEEARGLFTSVLDYRRPEGLSTGVGYAHLNLGQTELEAGELASAEGHFVDAADVFRAVGFRGRLANALQGLAAVEARTGRAEAAARRLGGAALMVTETGGDTGDSPLERAAIGAARDALGDEIFDHLFREGATVGRNAWPEAAKGKPT